MAQIYSVDNSRQQPETQPAKTPVERLLADARLRLVETGTRNRLVHTPRSSKRRRSLPIVGADADNLCEMLARSGRTMRFLPIDSTPALTQEMPASKISSIPRAAASSAFLQTNLEIDSLEKRLLAIYRDAKIAEEEQGINVLFLAIGFLRWFEDDKSEILREAPLVLVPVSLTRDPRCSTFDLQVRDEDIATNQAIQERLRTDFGITLPDLPEDEEWRPSDYFAAVRDAIAVKTRWSIDPNGVELGFYSFSKLLMIRDLDPAAWAEKAVLEHPLLRGLLVEGFNEEPAAIAADAKLDRLFEPSDLIQVVDADSSQTIVIETVRAGRNLVVQGPPGTGKSQTITNIIASAVHDGKSVLFVAEKMAALGVVHARLRRVGLGPICLELHSRGANKRLVLAELDETLNHFTPGCDPQDETTRISELRAALNAVDERMHAPVGKSGATPFQALSRLVFAREAGIASYPALLTEAAKWSAGEYASVAEATARLSEITAGAGPYFQHPCYGIKGTQLQPAELGRLARPLSQLAEAAVALADYTESIADYLGAQQEASLAYCATLVSILQNIQALPAEAAEVAEVVAGQKPSRILEAAISGIAWNDLKATYSGIFVDAAWNTPAAPLRLSLESGLSLFGRFWDTYRQGSKLLATLIKGPLPEGAQERIELVDKLIAVEKAREDLRAEDAAMGAMIPSHWRGEKTDFVNLHLAATVVLTLASQNPQPQIDRAIEIARQSLAKDYIAALRGLIETLIRAADAVLPVLDVDIAKAFQVGERDRIPLRSLAAKAHLWRDAQSQFDEWRRLAAADARLRTLSATALADALATGAMAAAPAKVVLDCTFAEAVWSKAVKATPALQEFYGP